MVLPHLQALPDPDADPVPDFLPTDLPSFLGLLCLLALACG